MSDEAHMESYLRRQDESRRRPWHAPQPDEAVMRMEEPQEIEWSYQAAVGCLLAFLFAEGAADWRRVAARAAPLLKRYAIERMERFDFSAVLFTGWQLEEFFELVGEDGAEVMGKVLRWFFQGDGRDRLRGGTQRVYLLTAVIDPQLLRVPAGPQAGAHERQMGFADIAMAFGELRPPRDGCERAPAYLRERAKARSKWSARAKKMVRRPIEAEAMRTERAPMEGAALFGKSAEVREKYREAARGNRNRLGKGKVSGKSGKNKATSK